MGNPIKVGFDSSTSLYTFKTPSSYSYKNLEVNGKSIIDPIQGYTQNQLVVTSEKPETITHQTSERKLIGYDNAEDSTIVSVEKYQEIVNQIDQTRDYDDSEEFIYETLEGEVFATRFFRTHKAIYETIETVRNIEIEYIEYPVSKYMEIVPLYSLDAKNVFETKCKYTPNLLQLFKEVVKEYGVTDEMIDVPSHSGLRFVQINDEYVSGIEDFQKVYGREIIGMYTECVERLEKTKKELHSIISFHFSKKSQKTLNKTQVGSLLTELKGLQNSVYGLDVKVKDQSSQRSIQNRINELIVEYKKLA